MSAAAAHNYPPPPALYKMLTYRRPHNSAGEREFIKDFIMPLRPEIISDDSPIAGKASSVPMAFLVTINTPGRDLPPPIMFTSHVDTVHAPLAATRQQVILKDGFYQKNDNQPLGADDAAGVWLMLNMIHNQVPGVYAFFRGEERGGIGSTYCAKDRAQVFRGLEAAIAFDRKGTQSIITHQHGGRGCSDEFGRSLARLMKMDYKLDSTGVYTDTAEFFDLIPNCTNMSVGYYNEHTKNEKLDKRHIEVMRDKLIAADWSALDFTPKKPDPVFPHWSTQNAVDGFREQGSKRLFEEYAGIDGQLSAGDLADIMFDQAEGLPTDLRDEVLALAQKIYKRIEG